MSESSDTQPLIPAATVAQASPTSHANLVTALIQFPPELDADTIEHLKALYVKGTPINTQRAIARDVAYFWSWASARAGAHVEPRYPVNVNLILKFISDHLDDNMDPDIEKSLRQPIKGTRSERPLKRFNGRLKPSTVRRYLSSLSFVHRAFDAKDNTVLAPIVKETMRLHVRARAKEDTEEAASLDGNTKRGGKKAAMTLENMDKIFAVFEDDQGLAAIRDRALLSVAYSSGGRRRSEMASMRVDQLEAHRNGYIWTMTRSKTNQTGEAKQKPIFGEAAEYLTAWLQASGITEGYVFRGMTFRQRLRKSISGEAINTIFKKRAAAAGLGNDFGGHSARAGFMTDAGKMGTGLPLAMSLSDHKTYQVAIGYYRDGEVENNPAAYLTENMRKNDKKEA